MGYSSSFWFGYRIVSSVVRIRGGLLRQNGFDRESLSRNLISIHSTFYQEQKKLSLEKSKGELMFIY
jgi:hypothetical protein